MLSETEKIKELSFWYLPALEGALCGDFTETNQVMGRVCNQ